MKNIFLYQYEGLIFRVVKMTLCTTTTVAMYVSVYIPLNPESAQHKELALSG